MQRIELCVLPDGREFSSTLVPADRAISQVNGGAIVIPVGCRMALPRAYR